MMVLELPPRLSFSSQVSTESRYGMYDCLLAGPPPLLAPDVVLGTPLSPPLLAALLRLWQLLNTCEFWAKVEITIPRVTRDLLILAPSVIRSLQ